MPAERYFIQQSLTLQDKIILTGPEFHHLVRVMRSREGDRIELVNGQGMLAQAIVQHIEKVRAVVLIENIYTETPNSTKVILAQAIPKPNRLDFILEKGTELGVDTFWLFPSQHSVKKDFALHQVDRLHALTVAAMKQCGRLFLPHIEMKPPIEKWPASFDGTAFFGDVEEGAPLFSNAWKHTSLRSPIVFIVGPESGLTDKEIALLRNKGAQGVKLHGNILRTDTASLVALSLIQHWLL